MSQQSISSRFSWPVSWPPASWYKPKPKDSSLVLGTYSKERTRCFHHLLNYTQQHYSHDRLRTTTSLSPTDLLQSSTQFDLTTQQLYETSSYLTTVANCIMWRLLARGTTNRSTGRVAASPHTAPTLATEQCLKFCDNRLSVAAPHTE